MNGLFDNTSACYKFFWFNAILTKLLEGQRVITYEELINEMILEAWYMVTEYHLNLGSKDTLEALVHYIQDISEMRSTEKQSVILAYLQTCSDKEMLRMKKMLTNMVPFRLQAPFLGTVNRIISGKSEKYQMEQIYKQPGLIYYFGTPNGMHTCIYIHDDWYDYFHENQEINELSGRSHGK